MNHVEQRNTQFLRDRISNIAIAIDSGIRAVKEARNTGLMESQEADETLASFKVATDAINRAVLKRL